MKTIFEGKKMEKEKVRDWQPDVETGNQHGLISFDKSDIANKVTDLHL